MPDLVTHLPLRYNASRGLLGSASTKNFDCVSCQLGKQLVVSFNTSESMSIDIFDLIHSDVKVPSFVFSIGESRYFVIFVNDYIPTITGFFI